MYEKRTVVMRVPTLCEDRVLDGPALGKKGL